MRSKDQIGEYLKHDEAAVAETQALLPGREFQFSYSVSFQLVEDVAWQHRLDNYLVG